MTYTFKYSRASSTCQKPIQVHNQHEVTRSEACSWHLIRSPERTQALPEVIESEAVPSIAAAMYVKYFSPWDYADRQIPHSRD